MATSVLDPVIVTTVFLGPAVGLIAVKVGLGSVGAGAGLSSPFLHETRKSRMPKNTCLNAMFFINKILQF